MTLNQSDIDRAQAAVATALRAHWKLFLIEGIVLVALGVLAIIVPQIATMAVAILLGWLFLISGVVGLAMTFSMRGAPGFWWSLISGLLAVAAGILLLGWPVSGAVSLTLVLVVFFLVEGVVTIMYALEHKRELSGKWGFMFASGIVDLVLGGIIFAGLPGTAAWAIGLLAGINLVFGGTAIIAMAMHARSSSDPTKVAPAS